MRHSIVPDILSERKIKFFDERDIKVTICEESDSNFISPFETPFLIIDTFAKKTTKKEEIVLIDLEELYKLDYIITRRKTSRGWFKGQKVIYLLEKKLNRLPGSQKMTYIPDHHKIQKDIPNKRIRLVGTNAGPNNYGPWCDI